ncbi:MAG: 30S ribosomal protein S4 [Candidatus Wolfebacteria bacterium GW2011_GWA2_42_10]|uniref:Small ribosomal subunit protein uS4 n=2 Tax=Candidatus Wolfeibacteriota TaxID=1752735 RepID=A0A0G0ZUE3_9BACT|nr:MAG: 30S ribosomal protein S4 [Candidatus Wolfebacteria bacterium GW2011_GWB1_41_12]KKS25606.1 MAG: 30S ribosomal protein S4 [Candidatus Wolfebacteria bacterium GW2011_GWA2_42_10]KKT56503.1 MAG: 30S ribosomal protein S4 [Candidatus Wolfebacteria bacterium GW2011_GWA1_44_24]
MLIKAKEKKERALGVKLFLKGERCSGPKCAMIRKPYRPGMHGKSRRRKTLSEYGQQLMEKQKIKISYGVNESQMRTIFKNAAKAASAVSAVINILETRLDNVIFRLGFAPNRITARQLASHGHIFVNGKKVRTPSALLKIGDVVSLNPSSKNILIFKELSNTIKKYEPPQWLETDKDKIEGKIKNLPFDIEMPFDINLVVDYYSR